MKSIRNAATAISWERIYWTTLVRSRVIRALSALLPSRGASRTNSRF